MDFLPTPFIPAGLDMNMESDSSGDSPFTPLSIEEDSSTGDGEMAEPSPFLPFGALEFDEKVFDDSFYSDRYRLLYLWLEAEFSYRRA